MHTLPTRREILKRAAVSSFAAASGVLVSGAVAAFGPVARVGGPLLKPGLNAYSFLEQLNKNRSDATEGIDLFGVCDFCAEHGIEAVDLTGYFFPGYPKPPADSYIHRIRRHAHDLGLSTSGTGIRNDFCTADSAVRSAAVELCKQWVEVAAKLGAPVVRLFADSQPPFKNWQQASGNASRDDVEAWMVENYRQCAEHAQKFGIILAVQNHGDFIASGEQHLALLKRVDHESCMALVDTGKYVTADPYVDIALVAPYAVNWQIKETLGSSMESPRTDFRRLVKIIRDSGYRGWLPIETLSMHRADYDPRVEVSKVLSELRAAIADTN